MFRGSNPGLVMVKVFFLNMYFKSESGCHTSIRTLRALVSKIGVSRFVLAESANGNQVLDSLDINNGLLLVDL